MQRSEDQRPPVAQTPSGVVRGIWRDETAVFRGIPYAEPPIGPLRFAAPVPRTPWQGTLDASAFARDGVVLVTIAGQSAGDGAVLTLLGTPGATGLFRAA